mgnify:CR=1 FL=1
MSRQEQIEQETKDIELFLALNEMKYTSFDLDCEKPDCDLQTEDEKIGIEVTEFVRSKEYCSKVRSVNATLNRIKVETKLAVSKLTDVNLTINYSQQSPPPRKINAKDREQIVAFLVNHVQKKEIQKKLKEKVFHIEYEYSKDENEFIESVRISTHPGKEILHVTENKIWMTGVIPKRDIEAIIEEKEPKMEFERNDKTWLLMVLAETEYSCGIIKPDVLEYEFNPSLFDRVFMLERFSKKIHELNICV